MKGRVYTMSKRGFRILLLILWAAFYVLGIIFAPFVTYTPRTGLSCIFFFLSVLSVLGLSLYEHKIDEQPKPLSKYFLKNWLAYLSNAAAYVLILIALSR